MRAEARIVALAGAVTILAAAGGARAQGTSSDAAATALFDEGRKLMDQHRWSEACPKLAESQRLGPSGGTLINLAECYEHTGQSASAWVAWKDAAARANAAGKRDVERKAIARASALEPSLARLTVAVDRSSDVDGLVVRRDGVAVGHAEFGMAIPIDPGLHVIEASAPKKKAFSAKVEVSPKQTTAQVTLTLEDEPVVAAAPGPTPAPSPAGPAPGAGDQPPAAAPGSSSQKTIGAIVGGAGLAGVAVGAVFGVVAKSKNDEALQPGNCRTSSYCTPQGLALTNDAKTAATASTIAFGIGAAAVAVGVVLWLTAPSASTLGVRAMPVVAQSYQGVALDAAW
jgi:hypothetical protein